MWVHVPDGSAILVVPVPAEAKHYPSVGGPDDLTEVLDQWETTGESINSDSVAHGSR